MVIICLRGAEIASHFLADAVDADGDGTARATLGFCDGLASLFFCIVEMEQVPLCLWQFEEAAIHGSEASFTFILCLDLLEPLLIDPGDDAALLTRIIADLIESHVPCQSSQPGHEHCSGAKLGVLSESMNHRIMRQICRLCL
jgi:hypothetical protein